MGINNEDKLLRRPTLNGTNSNADVTTCRCHFIYATSSYLHQLAYDSAGDNMMTTDYVSSMWWMPNIHATLTDTTMTSQGVFIHKH